MLSETSVLILKERSAEWLPKTNLWVESLILCLKKYILGKNLLCTWPCLFFFPSQTFSGLALFFQKDKYLTSHAPSHLFHFSSVAQIPTVLFFKHSEYLVKIGGISTSWAFLLEFAPPISGLKKGIWKVIFWFTSLKYWFLKLWVNAFVYSNIDKEEKLSVVYHITILKWFISAVG